MTLIIGLRCCDGVILGSDSQVTRGTRGHRHARPTQKVYEARPGFLLAWAGAQDVAQGFALRLARAEDLSPAHDRLETKTRLHEIQGEVRADPSIEDASNHLELLIAWWSGHEHKPVALHLFSGGRAEWVGTWAFGGVERGIDNASFAVGAMRHIDPAQLSLEQAKIVALKVLRDAIETNVEGIGGAPQMGTAQASGVHVVNEAERRGLDDTVDLWEAQCAELLTGVGESPSASATPDRGVRPPTER
jgi:proteasome beta subunit